MNSLKVVDFVLKTTLAVAHENAAFMATTNRTYDDQFKDKAWKIGDTLRLRDPEQYTRRQGSRIMAVQDIVQTTQNLTMGTQDGVDLKLNSAELSLADDDLENRHIEPAVAVMVSGIDGDYIAAMTKATYNSVGTPGTVPGASNDVTVLGQARGKLNQYLAPKKGGKRAMQLDSLTMASIINAYKLAFQDNEQVKEAYNEGFINRNAMADWYENDRTLMLANGSDVTGTLDNPALVTDGGNTLDMHTTVAVGTQAIGEVFTIAGVFACHPETKQAYAHLQQFVITAIGASLTTISPTIFLTGARKNCVAVDGTTLATTFFNSAALTFVGNASTSYRLNLMYHRDAYAIAFADLPLMDGSAKCQRDEFQGMAFRVWMDGDIRNDELLMRIDTLYGFLAQRPAWGTRIVSS